MAIPRFATLILVALAAGCGPDGKGGNDLPELIATRSTTFGDQEGEGALSTVWGVAVSEDGRVFLSEPPFARVVEFNADGSFSRVVGGRGDGPGEFRVPGALFWRGDSLAVSDFMRGISLFSPDGAFASLIAFNLSDASSSFGVRPIFPLADGSVAAFAPAPSNAVTTGSVTHESWLKASRDGVITDTLCVLTLEGRLYSVRIQGKGRSGPHPLAWAPLLTASPTGSSLVVVDRTPATSNERATYRVLRVGLDGDTIQDATLAYDPVPLTAGQVDSIATAMARGWVKGVNATVAAVASEIEEQVAWPEYQPPVTVVLAGGDGSVWLRREMVGAPSARWEVLDQELSPIGWVELPIDIELKVVARDRVYGVELDDFDVPRIVRFDVGEFR